MKQFKTSWLVCFAIVLFVIIACAVFLLEPRRNRFYKVEREFVYWHDADATNRLCELDSGTRGYMGPSAAYVFEERLKMYSPTCIVNRVIDRLRKDHPEIVSSDSEIRDVLSAAEYFNSGIIVPHVHVIVRSGDANLSLSVAESFVDVVADAVEEDSARTRSKAIDQIQRRLLRLQEERKLLSSASRTTENTEMEIRRIDTAIEGLNVDIERIKSLGSNTELRVFRVWDGVGGRSGGRDHTGAALQPSLEHGQGREARGGERRRDGDDDGRARVLRNSHQVPCTNAVPPVGYFATTNFNGNLTHSQNAGAGNLFRIGEGNYWTVDQSGRDVPYSNWSAGTLVWKVPIGWRRLRYENDSFISADTYDYEHHRDPSSRPLRIGNSEDVYTQVFLISESGTSSVEKFGYRLTRSRWSIWGEVTNTQ